MSYTPAVTFNDGTSLVASSVRANQDGLRDYVNGGIVKADLQADVFTTDDLIPPTALPIYNEVEFATGGFYRTTKMSEVTSQRDYFDGRIKLADITQQEVLQSLPSCGRQFFMPTTGDVVVEFAGRAVGWDPGNYAYSNRISPTPVLVNSNFYVVVDGVKQADSVCYIFPRQGGTPSAQSVAVGTGTAFGVGVNADRPLYLFFSKANLSAGLHTIEIVCDTRIELLYVEATSLQIEVLLDNGVSNFIGSDYLSGV
jgi:hypothetical protein